MAKKESTRSTAPGKRQVPLSDVTIIEAVLPDGRETLVKHRPMVTAGYALALYESLMWPLDNDSRKNLRDPIELVDMVSQLGDLMKYLGVEGGNDEPMDVTQADDIVRVAALCQQILLGFLRVAHKTDAELAARFVVQIGGAR